MYNAVIQCLEIFSAAFQGYCMQYFYGSFLKGRFENKRLCGIFAAAVYTAARLWLSNAFASDYRYIIRFAKLILTFGLLLFCALLFYKAVKRITVFLAVAFAAVSEISVFLAHIIMYMANVIFTLWGWCVEKGYITSVYIFNIILKITSVGLLCMALIISATILYFSLKCIIRNFRQKDYDISKTELMFILTPSLTGLFICILLRIIIVTMEDNIPSVLYDKYRLLLIIVPIILLLSLTSVLYGVRLFQDMIYLNRENSSKIILEKQINGMRQHIAEMERIYSGLRSMKHDMKNTLSVVMQLAANNGENKNTELEAYLRGLNRAMDSFEFRFRTGNTVVDIMLNMKYHSIIRSLPDLKMDAEGLLFPVPLFIQSYDIGIILGNALDNAIEACEKLKKKEPNAEVFIRLSSFCKGKMLFIETENSFDGKIILKHNEEFPITDKEDNHTHGIGLVNIKNAAQKYYGAVDWSANNKVFTLSVMLKNEMRIDNDI